ncbi:MAG: carboxypeptidase regulatory-like domain-containing protein [Flavobacteriales bacterium]|nr:carboxypeptidase regulatory-like domain-containing protein [Flavobacteriales bacterium]
MTMRCTHSLLPLALLLTIGAHAQHGEIRGRVLGPDGLSVPGANVIAEHNGNVVGAVTDIDGRFVLKPMPAGRHSVRISNVSFAPVEVADIAVTADRATYLHDVRMRFHTLSDTAVVIIGYRRKLIDIDDPARMSLLHEEIARDPNKRDPIALVSNNFAGVTAAMDGSGLHFRGSRTENMVSFIDGIKVTGSVPRIPPSAIGSISVYTGGLPAKYGDVTGGVVVIETRTYQEMVQAARARHDDPDL